MGTKAIAPKPPRLRWMRWLVAAAILLLLLAIYAVALRWFALRLETDIQKSLRSPPVTQTGALPLPAPSSASAKRPSTGIDWPG